MIVHAPAYSAAELDIMRVGLGVAAISSLQGLRMFAPTGEATHPVGLARLVAIRWTDAGRRAAHHLGVVAALAYAADVATTWALCVISALLVVEVTSASSGGAVNHGHHLVALVASTQVAAVAVWNAAQRFGIDLGHVAADGQAATAAWWSVQAIVAVYFTAGLTKVLRSGGGWVATSPGLLLAALGRLDMMSAVGTPAVERRVASSRRLIEGLLPRPALARMIFASGLLIELATPRCTEPQHLRSPVPRSSHCTKRTTGSSVSASR